jgi:hypothetical protein
VEVVFDDLRLRWETLPLPARFAQGSFGPIDGAITVQVRGPQSAAIIALADPRSGATVNARANPTATGWNLSAGLSGDLVAMFGALLSTSLLDIQRMPVRGQAGLDYVAAARKLTLDLDLEEHDAAVEGEAVARGAVTGFEARQRARALVDLEARTLSVDEALVEVNGVPVVLSVAVKPGATSPAFSVKADLRTTPFARLLKSVPGGEALDIAKRMSPNLAFALSASISGELKAEADRKSKGHRGLRGAGSLSDNPCATPAGIGWVRCPARAAWGAMREGGPRKEGGWRVRIEGWGARRRGSGSPGAGPGEKGRETLGQVTSGKARERWPVGGARAPTG